MSTPPPRREVAPPAPIYYGSAPPRVTAAEALTTLHAAGALLGSGVTSSTVMEQAQQRIMSVLQCAGAKGAWPDEVDVSDLCAENPKAVSAAYLALINKGLIKQTGSYKRSQSPKSHATKIWQYVLVANA